MNADETTGSPRKSPRIIPRATMVDVVAPSSSGGISAKNLAFIAQLNGELRAAGVLGDGDTMRGIHDEDEISEVLRDAEERSLSEEELNPEYYNPRLDQELMALDADEINPLMQKFDDYEGLDYNPAFRARDRRASILEGSKKRRKI